MLQECPYRLVTLDDGGRIFAGQASDEFVNEVLYLRPGAGGLHLIAPAPQPVARCPAHVCLRIPKSSASPRSRRPLTPSAAASASASRRLD